MHAQKLANEYTKKLKSVVHEMQLTSEIHQGRFLLFINRTRMVKAKVEIYKIAIVVILNGYFWMTPVTILYTNFTVYYYYVIKAYIRSYNVIMTLLCLYT